MVFRLLILGWVWCFSLVGEESGAVGTHRVLQFENEYVRVWKTVIMPNQPLKMHRHDYSRVVVGLKGGTLTKIEETGETSPLSFETGKAYWLTEDPLGTLHGDVNESEEPIEVMVIEMKSGKLAQGEKKMGLIEVRSIVPHIQIDLKYATKDNFTGEVIYNFKKCLLLEEAVLKLEKVQRELEDLGLGLKIWDGYRPMAAQWKLWNIVPDERYVTDPRKGGRHTRGTAVDLTLITREGKELPMPSGFDEFNEKAHRDYEKGTQEERNNRALLQNVMEKHGFVGFSTEWWHFDLEGWENYPPLDIEP